MGSRRPVRFAALIWDHLLAGTLLLSAGRHRWRLGFRAACVAAAVALCTGVLAATPAQAAPAGQARAGLAAAGAQIPITYPGGDMVATYDYANVSPLSMEDYFYDEWPEAVGLSPNPSLSDLFQASWKVLYGHTTTPPPQPALFTGGSVTVSADATGGSIVTFDIPAADFRSLSSDAESNFAINLGSTIAGALAGAVLWGMCGALGFPGGLVRYATPRTVNVCTVISGIVLGGAVTAALSSFFTANGGIGLTVGAFLGAAAGSIAAFGTNYFLSPLMVRAFIAAGNYLSSNSVWAAIFSFLQGWITGEDANTLAADMAALANSMESGLLERTAEELQMGGWASIYTLSTLGEIGNGPSASSVSTTATNCMDAYGSTDAVWPTPGAVPGQAVAINTCDGNAAQDWTVWGSGAITVWGLCLDSTGGSPVTISGTQYASATLQYCDGESSQVWYQYQGELVNASSHNCLDDPAFDTAPGTQLILYPCNGGANQQWALPPGAQYVSSFGTVANNSSNCMDAYGSSGGASPGQLVAINTCNGNAAQNWTVGANGTVMVWDLCLDSAGGGTDSSGDPLVTLQLCDSSSTQLWTVDGNELVNDNNNECLDDPAFDTTPGTQLILFSCKGSTNQSWVLPNANPASPAPSPPHDELRILPFGDSITYGIDSSTGGGYRCDLLSELAAGTEMVGSQVAGDCSQPDNEGHSGWTIEGLQSIENCTITGYEPNVVLLDAGTNDVNVNTPSVIVDGGDPTHAADALESLVTSIRNDDPGVVVIVGGLIPTPVAQTAANMTSFNQQVSAWISQQQGAGWDVGWADMSAVTTSDLADGLHPDDTGYQLMANSWDAAINQAEANGWVQSPNAPTSSGCAAPPTSGPPAPTWQAQGLIAPGVQGYAPPLWSAQGEVAPGVQASGWTDALGQEIRFASLGYSSREDYLFIQPDSEVLGWRNDGPAPGGGYTWTSVGVVAPGIQGSGYAGPQDGQIEFADVSGDGKADYVWVHTNGSLSVWVNDGIGSNGDPGWVGPVNNWNTFSDPSSVSSPQDTPQGYDGTGSIQFADLDGDGLPDYVWVHTDGSITWWKNSGNGWNDEGTIPGVGAPGSEVHFGYAFGGRQEDMLVVAPDSSTTAYVLNTGTNTWRSEGLVAPGIQDSGYTGPNDGDIDFANLSGTGGLDGLQNGRDDFVWVRPDSSVMMWQNIAGAGLDNQIQFADLEPGTKASADYIDVSPLDGSVSAWINGGPAAGGGYSWVPEGDIFSGPPNYAGPGNGSVGNIQLADIGSPGQSYADVLYIQPDGSVQGWALIATNGGLGGLSLGTVVPKLANGYNGTGEIQFADMTGDGLDDYLWVRPDSSVMMWQDAAGWPSVGEIAPGVQASGWTDSPGQYIRFADITGSGRADYLFIRPDSSVLAWYNPGPSANYDWEAMGVIAPGVQASGWVAGTPGNQVEFADMTGDGRADYLWVRPDSSVVMWQNTPG